MLLPRLRYSLRTFLIVIALVACWLGYQLRIKSQRQELLAAIKVQGGEIMTYEAFQMNYGCYQQSGGSADWVNEKPAHISWIRSWLGDAPLCYIKMGSSQGANNRADYERIEALFPEALVILGEELACEQMRMHMLLRRIKQ